MIRNLKAMGLAMFALLALGAIGVQSASAAVEHTFRADASNKKTVLTGTTEEGTTEKFKLTGATVSCEDIVYRGTGSNAQDHATVYPDFSNPKTKCNAGALGTATITNHGCTYTLGSDTNVNTAHFAANEEHANVSVVCAHTNKITIAAGGCTIAVGDTNTGTPVNQALPGVRYTNIPNHSAGKSAVTVSATVKTIHATTSGANCVLVGLGNPGTHVNGSYEGKVIVTGFENTGGGENVHPTSDFTEGPVVNISVGL